MSNKGRYLMDYSRKYGDPYDIRDKARIHVRKLKAHDRERTAGDDLEDSKEQENLPVGTCLSKDIKDVD